MGRKKNSELENEAVTPMEEGAINPPVEEEVASETVEEKKEDVVEEKKEVKEEKKESKKASYPVIKKVSSPTTLVNFRKEPEGEIFFTVRNSSKVTVVAEKDGWSKIEAYVKTELLGDI